MSKPIDYEKLAPSGIRMQLPSIPSIGNGSIESGLRSIKEILEVREGRRGSKYEQNVTWRDLIDSNLVTRGQRGWGSSVFDSSEKGLSFTEPMRSALESEIRNSAAYKRLIARVDSEDNFAGFPQEVVQILRNDIAEEARKRKADIRSLQSIVQSNSNSFAMKVDEVTAAINTAQAGVRQITYASASQAAAQAGQILTVKARLDDFGGDGVTVEEKMTATVDRLDGMIGSYSIKVGAGGKYAGLQLAVDAPVGSPAYSSFLIDADKFAIFTSGGSVSPFGVDASGVYMNGTVRINANGTSLATLAANAAVPTLTFIGTFTSNPAGTKNNVYKNSTNGNSYIHNGSTWVLYLEKGIQGIQGIQGFVGQGQVKAVGFTRNINDPGTPVGGTYAAPTPTTVGWSDGIPTGTAPLWMTTRIFTSDGASPQQSVWTTPRMVSNTSSVRYQFSTDNSTWSDTASTNSNYIRTGTSNDGGTTWSYSAGVLVKGEQGQATYTWIKYADNGSGSNMSDFPSGKAYIGIAYNKTTATESSNALDYDWALIKGDQGIQGIQGPQGLPTYTWIKYADDTAGTGLTDDPTGKKYIGIAPNKTTATESTNYADYSWALIKGDQGIQGIQGIKGDTTYTWIKYADTSTGGGMSDFPAGKAYLGVAYNKTTDVESNNAGDYSWSLIQGNQGIQGPVGPQGQPTYTWIKYADTSTGGNMSDSPTNKTYIGIAPNKTTATESEIAGDYTWALIQGAAGKDAVGIELSNDSHGVPCNLDGSDPVFAGATTTATIYVGAADDSASWTWTTSVSNLTITGANTRTVTVTAMSADTGYVDFVATKSGSSSQTARFSVYRAKGGAYWVVPSVGVIKKSEVGVYTPTTVTFNSYLVKVGGSLVGYTGRFRVESLVGTTVQSTITRSTDEAAYTYTVPADATHVRVSLFKAGATTDLLDQETIAIIADGGQGGVGPTGPRGSMTFYAIGTPWLISDAEAATGGANNTANSTVTSITGSSTRVIGDTVTITNSGGTATGTRYWSGTAWVKPGVVIDGNLLVSGTISATKINGGDFTGKTFTGGLFDGASFNGVTIGALSLAATQINFTKLSGAPVLYSASGTNTPLTVGDGGSFVVNATSMSVNTATTITTNGVTPLSVTSGNSGFVAASFTNSALSKGISLGGSYCAYAGSGQGKIYILDGNGPFTGFHDGLMDKMASYAIGDIVTVKRIIYKRDISNALAEIELSDVPMQKTGYGIISELMPMDNHLELPYELWWSFEATHNLFSVNGVGEGQINVCGESGNISAGDLIVTSSMRGKGMRGEDNTPANRIIAKALEPAIFTSPTDVHQIACVYMCG